MLERDEGRPAGADGRARAEALAVAEELRRLQLLTPLEDAAGRAAMARLIAAERFRTDVTTRAAVVPASSHRQTSSHQQPSVFPFSNSGPGATTRLGATVVLALLVVGFFVVVVTILLALFGPTGPERGDRPASGCGRTVDGAIACADDRG